MLKPLLFKFLRWAGYALFASVCGFLFMIWTFPLDQFKGTITSYLEREYKLRMDMETLATSLPIGVKSTGISLEFLEEPGTPFLPMDIQSFQIGAGFWGMLTGEGTINFSAEIFGGAISGRIREAQEENLLAIDFKASNLKFEEFSYFRNSFKDLPMNGQLSMTGNLEFHLAKSEQSRGTLDIQISEASTGPGKMMGIELPKVVTGTLDCKMGVKNGKIEIEQCRQSSSDMMSDLIGYIQLPKSFQNPKATQETSSIPFISPLLVTLKDLMIFWKGFKNSKPTLDFRFKPTDELIKKHTDFKVFFTALKQAEGSDKYFYYTFKGTSISAMSPVPNKASQSRFKGAGGSAAGSEASKEAGKPPSTTGKTPPKTPPPVKPGTAATADKPPATNGASGTNGNNGSKPAIPPTSAPPIITPPVHEPSREPPSEPAVVEEETHEEVTDEPAEESPPPAHHGRLRTREPPEEAAPSEPEEAPPEDAPEPTEDRQKPDDSAGTTDEVHENAPTDEPAEPEEK